MIKTSSNPNTNRRFKGSLNGTDGFALVSTMVVLALIIVLLVGLLSMSTTATRGASLVASQEQARANAKMAMNLALGDLQKYAGPDRRVTSTAEILGDSVVDQKRNWTTIWDTSVWEVQDPVSSRDTQSYMGVLVSGNEMDTGLTRAEAASDLALAVPTSDPAWVGLVTDGSVNASEDFVYAPLEEVQSGDSTGKFAYWVGDEGVKARFDVKEDPGHISNTWATAGRMGQALGSGIHKITGMSGYADYLPDAVAEQDLDRFIDFRTLELSSIDRITVKDHFHDVTTAHTGLLVDNRWGGIRHDLSTAFELSLEEFGEIEEFNSSGEQNLTRSYKDFIPSDLTTNPLYYAQETDNELGYLFEVPVDSSRRYRGPTWDLLRNHYRVYKKERNNLNFRGLSDPSDSDTLMAHGVLPLSYDSSSSGSVNNSIGSFVAGPHMFGGLSYTIPIVAEHGVAGTYNPKQGGRTQPTVQKLTPQLIRAVFVYGLARNQDNYFLTIDPFFILHNPYNQALEFYSVAVDLHAMMRLVDFTVRYQEEGTGANRTVVFNVQEGGVGGGAPLKTYQSFRLTPNPSGNHRLEAGEIKVMSVDPGRDNLGGGLRVISLAELQYNEGAGIYLGASGKTMKVAAGSTITVEAKRINDNNGGAGNISCIYTRLLHPLAASGGSFQMNSISSFNTVNNFNRNHDYEKMTLIQQMRIMSLDAQTLSERRSANVNQIPSPQDGSFYMYALDIGLKDFSDDVAVMSDFNYRTLGFGPRDYDGGDSIGPNWDLELKPTDLFDLQLADANSNAYWGEGKTPADGGSSKIVLFDLPRSPMTSLAGLQHADTSMLNFHPMHSIANSRMQVGQTDQRKTYNRLRQIRTSTTPRYQIDTSWAANEALWDRFYFSGMNWGSSSGQPFSSQDAAVSALAAGESERVLTNSRLSVDLESFSGDLSELKDYRKIGRHLKILGAFNVNSTSVEAWKAVLASLSGREITYLAGDILKEEKIELTKSPMSRMSTPAGWDDDNYAGFRSLTDPELELLAEAIVEQVKLRGPFMGLSDFVNRRLESDDTGKSGAIQAAIDEANLNSSVKIGNTIGNRLKQSAPDANQGMARHLNQADVLTPLAPIMATRSDTFIIRAYGDSRGANGTVQARAWCEVVVQRTAEWMEDTDEASTIAHPDYPRDNSQSEPILRQWVSNPSLPDLNQNFGRRFKIKSFRWLSPDEV